MRTFLKFIVLVVIGLYGLNYLFSGESRKIEKSEKLKTLVTEDVFKKKKIALVNGKEIKLIYAEDQNFLSNIIKEVRAENQSVNNAVQKINWINANKTLCSSNIFKIEDLKKNWIGKLKSINMDDSGIYVDIKIDIDHENLIYATSRREEITDKVIKSLKGYEEVIFSGYFKKGDISENQCIDSIGFNDNPILMKNKFVFKLTDFNKITFK